MDLRQLRYFAATVRTGSISAAARNCGVSQPSLSQQIKTLEEDLGEPLLIRQSRGTSITEAGKILMQYAERLLAEEQELRLHFDTRSTLQSGKLSFGIIPTMAPYLLPRILGPFRQLYPAIDISVREAQTHHLIDMVASGDLEFAILSDIDSNSQLKLNLELQVLFQEPLVLATPSSHQFAKPSAEIAPQDVDATELIHLQDGHCLTDQTLTACKLSSLDSSLQCDQLETALAMVNSGLGIAIVPQLATYHTTWPSVIFKEFTSPAPKREIILMTRHKAKLAPPAQALASSLTTALGKK